ncbi:hypothetical protein LX16_2189 [Stackebrandtia albiflava]|uniref:Uncharacterized protein n=1 Tax=Stackebrandtia albiflava TaxID=406432 RepID=A0A562V0Y8_9ACTN|nr:hypothetical protein [Stackebrandtia albiflava]TWJ11467.1 hypothetical protein LX16_2189 [Stackebrandtia albiflava]
MSVLYRAVWSDTPTSGTAELLNHYRDCVAAWAQATREPVSLTVGRSEFALSQGRRRFVNYRAVGSEAFEVTVSDDTPADTTEWTTVIRVVADEDRLHTLVETGMESDDFTQRASVGRPRVVHDLLVAAAKPTPGRGRLLTAPEPVPAEGIDIVIDLLADPDRTLPVIVGSEPWGVHDGSWLKWARDIASRVQGVAVVLTLDTNAVEVFKRELGTLATWGGGIRVYAPVPVMPDTDGWRHRYYPRSRLETVNQLTIDRIVYSVAQLSVTRRIPKVFGVFAERNERPTGIPDGMVPIADLQREREEWEFQHELDRDELSILEEELSRANGHLSRLKKELLSRGLGGLLWGTEFVVDEDSAIPDQVQDTSSAVSEARRHLSEWLAIPDSAERELGHIDTGNESHPWAKSAWRGLRALAAYAEDRANGWSNGGFWEWCVTGPVLGWPATPKKLSMKESETVHKNEKLRRKRVFKVDSAVDPSGEIAMFAHLKIAEGGGRLAPRIYFHDDTGGTTRKVHIGFIGPHHLIPNKSTN